MKAIRNFIYNTSDILVALLIILVAVLLIWSRIAVIMGYPGVQTGANTAAEEVTAEADVPATETETGYDPSVEGDLGQVTEEDPDPMPEPEYREVTIPMGSSTDVVAGLLRQANIISDTNDFITELRAQGMNGRIMPGVHRVPVGSDIDTVIQILCQHGEEAADAAQY